MHWAANSSTPFMPDQQFVDFLSCLNPTRISFSSAIYLNSVEAEEQRNKWSYVTSFPLLLLWFIGQRNYFLFSRALLITARKKIAPKIKESVFTVDLPFIKLSKRFPRSCNAPSTKSAHAVTDISSMKTVHQRQRSPDSPTTPILNSEPRSLRICFFQEPKHLLVNKPTEKLHPFSRGFVHLHPEGLVYKYSGPSLSFLQLNPKSLFLLFVDFVYFQRQSMNKAMNPSSCMQVSLVFQCEGLPTGK